MKKKLNEGNQIHNFILSVRTFVIPIYYGSGSGTQLINNYGSGFAKVRN
jgi:hypothetical protein